jgi:hypothetical protein
LCFDPCSLAYDASYQVSTFSEPNGSTAWHLRDQTPRLVE